MSFRKVDTTFKLDVIKDLWGSMNYSQVSVKYGIPRSTIYKWERIAEETLNEAFEHQKPGKKKVDLNEENQKLKEQVRILYHDKHNIAQNHSEDTVFICQECGSSHIKKNGTVLTKQDGLRQRYSCVACSWSVYVDVKKTLHISS